MIHHRYYLSAVMAAVMLSGCSSSASLTGNSQNTNGISPEVIEAAEAEAKENNREFVQDNAGLPPTEIIELRYEKAIQVSGPPNEYFELFNSEGEPNWEHAYYIAEHLQVDYSKTAYIQYNGGTYGLESTLAAMDQKFPGVTQTLTDFQRYHVVTDLDSDFWKEKLATADTPQAKAELIVSTLADEYRRFYGEANSNSSTQQATVATISQLTGLSSDDLTVIWEGRGYLSDIIEVLPNDWPYKTAVLDLL